MIYLFCFFTISKQTQVQDPVVALTPSMTCVYTALLKPQGSVQTPDLSIQTFHLALGFGLDELPEDFSTL